MLDDAVAGAHPLVTLADWLAEAKAAGEREPTAMALATVDSDGQPSVRHVLCKDVDMRGVRFYTKVKTVTARWPEGDVEDSAFVIPTMK